MAKNYKALTESVKSRINPENLIFEKSFRDELSSISYRDVLVYIRLAMKGVEPEYTQCSKDAGERVKDHLRSNLSDVTFQYQGSVMTNTHIKAHSDIDLLTISDKFYTYDRAAVTEIVNSVEKRNRFSTTSIQKLENEVNTSNYTGDSLDDLRNLRIDSERTLSEVYSVCDVTLPKAIKIKNLNLNREVDIVIANWYDDVTSIINSKGDYRGVQIYHKDTHSKGNHDYPFLSIKRINDRGNETNGRLKRMIRFLKNVKADSDSEIDLSSFDINAICYDIPANRYQTLTSLELVPVIYHQLASIDTNETHANDIVSVDGREYIFRNNPQKLNNIRTLFGELLGIYQDYTKV